MRSCVRSTERTLRAIGLAVALSTAAVPRADGAEPGAPSVEADKARAKVLYTEAERHYMLGEYEAAAEKYKEAYRARAEPIFLFNAAQAYRRAGRSTDAIHFYKNYLLAAPEAPNRATAERFIAELEALLRAAGEAAARPPSEPLPPLAGGSALPASRAAPPPAATSPAIVPGTAAAVGAAGVRRSPWPWVAASAVAVVAAVGAGVLVAALASRRERPWVIDFVP